VGGTRHLPANPQYINGNSLLSMKIILLFDSYV